MGRKFWMKDPTWLTYWNGVHIFVWIRRLGWLGGIGGMLDSGVPLLMYFFRFDVLFGVGDVDATCGHDRNILVYIGCNT